MSDERIVYIYNMPICVSGWFERSKYLDTIMFCVREPEEGRISGPKAGMASLVAIRELVDNGYVPVLGRRPSGEQSSLTPSQRRELSEVISMD